MTPAPHRPVCAHCSDHGCSLCLQAPARTPAEALHWRVSDILPLLEQLAAHERQGTAAPALARRVAEALASASGAAERIQSEHLAKWSRTPLERVVDEALKGMGRST